MVEKPLIVVFGVGIQNNKPSDFLRAIGIPAQQTNDVSIKYYVREYFANLKVFFII